MISEKDRSELMIRLLETRPQSIVRGEKLADEGGCGVVGCASSVQIAGRHFLTALDQMKNRGNGKGGGVAMLGLDPEQWGVSADILRENFILQVAYLDESVISEVEASFVDPVFEVNHHSIVPTIDDHTSIDLEIRPPVVYQYFVRVKKQKIIEFANSIDLHDHELDDEFVYNRIEEEIVYQNSYLLNESFYASLGNKQAFVLSHAKNLLLFKLVGYGDQVIRYYKLQDTVAHIWIGHHRYPTKGTVWHPGGAHPFIGLNEALVHNGDFSNHHAVGEYLAQRNIYQQFLTDTEVAVLQFDLYSRIYRYPTEYIIEAIAPTTERDFWELPEDRQQLYERIQHSHLHGSPDGPWFFIIGRSLYEEDKLQLLGITDTSMLRPQVFALQQSDEVQIGLIGSERQAIDATLRSLSFEDNRFASKADIYWNARGGSHTDGGAFLFNVI